MWGSTKKKSNVKEPPSYDRVEELYKKWGPTIYSRCRRMLRDSSRAEDATQEIFVSVLRHIESAPDDRTALYWLYRITTNYCLNQMRNQSRQIESMQELPEWESEHPLRAVENRDLAQRLINRVPETLRATALLYYVDGLDQTKVAEVLGISRRTVINYLQDFNRRAQKFMARHGEVSNHDD